MTGPGHLDSEHSYGFNSFCTTIEKNEKTNNKARGQTKRQVYKKES